HRYCAWRIASLGSRKVIRVSPAAGDRGKAGRGTRAGRRVAARDRDTDVETGLGKTSERPRCGYGEVERDFLEMTARHDTTRPAHSPFSTTGPTSCVSRPGPWIALDRQAGRLSYSI